MIDEGVIFAGGEEGEKGLVAMPRALRSEGGVVSKKRGEGVRSSRGSFVFRNGSFIGGKGAGIGDAGVKVEAGFDGSSERPSFEGFLPLSTELEGFGPAAGLDAEVPGDGGRVFPNEWAGRRGHEGRGASWRARGLGRRPYAWPDHPTLHGL